MTILFLCAGCAENEDYDFVQNNNNRIWCMKFRECQIYLTKQTRNVNQQRGRVSLVQNIRVDSA